MTKNTIDTEHKILEAARTVFEKKGMYGARMQEIADEAGINKALLHYYFRTKEKLFDAVFIKAFKSFFPNLIRLFQTEMNPKEKITVIVDHYFNMISTHPFLPIFIITEVNRNPDRIHSLLAETGMNHENIMSNIRHFSEHGILPNVDPRHIIINLMSLTVFPYLSKPLMKNMFFNNNESDYQTFLLERRNIIIQMLLKQPL